MNIKKSIILLLLFCACLCFSEEENDTRYTNLFITGYIDASESIKSDNNLNFISFGMKAFETTEWGFRFGGEICILISTNELIEGVNSFLYGGLFPGIFLGQSLRIWQITLSINLFLGAGISISNLWISPWHIDYLGEINVEAGVIITENFTIHIFTGFQSVGNLFPQLPCTAYLMYYPVWGIAVTW